MVRTVLLLLTLVSLPLPSVIGGIFGPSNYEDCVLEGLKTARTKEAVNSVHSMCRRKFNVPIPSLPVPERMKGDCRVVYDGKNMYPAKSKPHGYKGRRIKRDGVEIATIYVPEEMNTKTENWAGRMFIEILNHCDISFF